MICLGSPPPHREDHLKVPQPKVQLVWARAEDTSCGAVPDATQFHVLDGLGAKLRQVVDPLDIHRSHGPAVTENC